MMQAEREPDKVSRLGPFPRSFGKTVTVDDACMRILHATASRMAAARRAERTNDDLPLTALGEPVST